MQSINLIGRSLVLAALVAIVGAGCESTPGGAATGAGEAQGYHARATDEAYTVAVEGSSQFAKYYFPDSDDKLILASMEGNTARQIVFRGKDIAAVPHEIKESIVQLERIMCELQMESKRIYDNGDNAGKQAHGEYLASVSQKVRSQTAQNLANNTATNTFVTAQMHNMTVWKAEQVRLQAQDVANHQATAVKLLSERGIKTFRVYQTGDGPKAVLLPEWQWGR